MLVTTAPIFFLLRAYWDVGLLPILKSIISYPPYKFMKYILNLCPHFYNKNKDQRVIKTWPSWQS